MKKSISLLGAIALLTPCWPLATDAATQVYDLSVDWSDTQNPAGPWSYREGNSLLVNNPLAWVGACYDGCLYGCGSSAAPAIEKFMGAVNVYPNDFYWVSEEHLQNGDVLFVGRGNILWTAPVSGNIEISGATWQVSNVWLAEDVIETLPPISWTLTQNGSSLGSGHIAYPVGGGAGSPSYFSSDSAGMAALQNVPIAAGDQIVLAFSQQVWVGLNLAITLTPDSLDPISAVEALATTVIEINLQNGIADSLDSKLDAALNVLLDVNVSNDGAACNSLQAFIGSVEAQRAKKITNAQADRLIASAHEIKALLHCGN